MATFRTEEVLTVHHWNERLFSFATTRGPGFRFESGHFVMVGLEVDGRPLMRAYSIASPHYADRLEFLSVKMTDGPLTSRLQHIQPGTKLLLSSKPVGTLLLADLRPGRRLYLLATGTGLAPFLSIIQDPETYERFEHVILVHGVRRVSDLAYADFITRDLPDHELLGEAVRAQLSYYPATTREESAHHGRITALIASGALFRDVGMPPLDPATDRAMICGGPEVLADISAMLDARGFEASSGIGHAGDYVIERAFVER